MRHAILACFLLLGSVHAADLVKVTAAQPLRVAHAVQIPINLEIDNRTGKIALIEGDGNAILVSATQKGSKPVDVELGRSGPADFKIVVKYPDAGGGFRCVAAGSA